MLNINYHLPAFPVPSQKQHLDDEQMVKVETRVLLVVGRLFEEVVSSISFLSTEGLLKLIYRPLSLLQIKQCTV